ncbi:hypothetical protein LDHU3_29.1980:CDS1 [Leishmania donovani]|uniref:Hypothetical_protein n=1 Tax=Leishmania donovani TaxID=5661 RepID=A0A6J8FHX4_LEIDO|nr:hypothetical protein LDHU3_29.1980:CDS1 [Leishmania donovani]VDZ46469.1 hypothetical_protein [Leishmania donovani]
MGPVPSREQALACTQHTTDAVSRNHLINITAASGNGLAELLAAVHPRRVPAARHASQLQATCADGPVLRAALQQLSASPLRRWPARRRRHGGAAQCGAGGRCVGRSRKGCAAVPRQAFPRRLPALLAVDAR